MFTDFFTSEKDEPNFGIRPVQKNYQKREPLPRIQEPKEEGFFSNLGSRIKRWNTNRKLRIQKKEALKDELRIKHPDWSESLLDFSARTTIRNNKLREKYPKLKKFDEHFLNAQKAANEYVKKESDKFKKSVEEEGALGGAKQVYGLGKEAVKGVGRGIFSITTGAGEGLTKLAKKASPDGSKAERIFQRIDDDYDTLQDMVLKPEEYTKGLGHFDPETKKFVSTPVKNILSPDEKVAFGNISTFVGEVLIPYTKAESATVKFLAPLVNRYPKLTRMFAAGSSGSGVSLLRALGENSSSKEAQTDILLDWGLSFLSAGGGRIIKEEVKRLKPEIKEAIVDIFEEASELGQKEGKQFIEEVKKIDFKKLADEEILSRLRKALENPKHPGAFSPSGDVTLEHIVKKAKDKGIFIEAVQKGDEISVSKIVVPKGKRNKGIGTAIMREIAELADFRKSKIVLTPTKEFGASSKKRLEEFYKRLGFVENKGKNKDFSTRETFIRLPKTGETGIKTSPLETPSKLDIAADYKKDGSIQRNIFGEDIEVKQAEAQKKLSQREALQKTENKKSGKIFEQTYNPQGSLFEGGSTNKNVKESLNDIQDQLRDLKTRRGAVQDKIDTEILFGDKNAANDLKTELKSIDERIKKIEPETSIKTSINPNRVDPNNGREFAKLNNLTEAEAATKLRDILGDPEMVKKIEEVEESFDDIIKMANEYYKGDVRRMIDELHDYQTKFAKEQLEEVKKIDKEAHPEFTEQIESLADFIEQKKLFLAKALGINKVRPTKAEIEDFFQTKDWDSLMNLARERQNKSKLAKDFYEKFKHLDEVDKRFFDVEESAKTAQALDGNEVWELITQELTSGRAHKRVADARRARGLETRRLKGQIKQEPPKAKKEDPKEQFETLPKEVNLEEESKLVGAKRIAPDRVIHQQLTPEDAMKKMKAEERELFSEMLQILDKHPYGIRASKGVFKQFDSISEKLTKGTATDAETKWHKKVGDRIEYARTTEEVKKRLKDKNLFRRSGAREKIHEYIEGITNESIKEKYIELVKGDISRGYRYPEEVLNFDKGFKTAVNNRERYEKGLRTSFSADDERIIFEDKDIIGAGMKRQDGKELTFEQKTEIKESVVDFANALGLDMKKLAKDDRWVYVHLNNKNPFLMKATAGLYRRAKNSVSISVGGREVFEKMVDGKKVKEYINPTMAHELGHALDFKAGNKLFEDNLIRNRRYDYNPTDEFAPRGVGYYRRATEIVARMIEQYVSVSKGSKAFYDRQGYWKKEIFENEIKPAVEEAIKKHYSEFQTTKKVKLEKRYISIEDFNKKVEDLTLNTSSRDMVFRKASDEFASMSKEDQASFMKDILNRL